MMISHDESDQGRGSAGIVDTRVARLIALGASMAANNEAGFAEGRHFICIA